MEKTEAGECVVPREELRALREDRKSLNAMATLLARARKERDEARAKTAEFAELVGFERARADKAAATLRDATNLLSDIHDHLLPQEDADCVDGTFVPNSAMRFVQEIDALLAASPSRDSETAAVEQNGAVEALRELYDACVALNVANGRCMVDRHAMNKARGVVLKTLNALSTQGADRGDAERLDWYERACSEGHPHTPECHEGVWCYPYLVVGAGGFGGGVGHKAFASLREAIDSARKDAALASSVTAPVHSAGEQTDD
jgi:hypothetical protein